MKELPSLSQSFIIRILGKFISLVLLNRRVRFLLLIAIVFSPFIRLLVDAALGTAADMTRPPDARQCGLLQIFVVT